MNDIEIYKKVMQQKHNKPHAVILQSALIWNANGEKTLWSEVLCIWDKMCHALVFFAQLWANARFSF